MSKQLGDRLRDLNPDLKSKIMSTFQSVKKRNRHLTNDQILVIVADILEKQNIKQ